MSAAPPQGAPPAAPEKKSKALLWTLLGLGGCVVAGVAALALVIGIAAVRLSHRRAEALRQLSVMQVRMEEDELTTYLENDPDRSEKVRKVWDELRKQADAGELKDDESAHLSDEVRKITADGQVTPDEADEAIEMGSKVAGI